VKAGLRAAVVGYGPSGSFVAQELSDALGSDAPDRAIDVYERLPVPYGDSASRWRTFPACIRPASSWRGTADAYNPRTGRAPCAATRWLPAIVGANGASSWSALMPSRSASRAVDCLS
jgi:hypothetical protein